MSIATKVQALLTETAGTNWFNELPREQQKAYLKAHPHSQLMKFAANFMGDAKKAKWHHVQDAEHLSHDIRSDVDKRPWNAETKHNYHQRLAKQAHLNAKHAGFTGTLDETHNALMHHPDGSTFHISTQAPTGSVNRAQFHLNLRTPKHLF